MTQISLHYLPGFKQVAENLGALLNISSHEVDVHTFPDGENRIQVSPNSGTAILYASLNFPNEKLLQLAFAASALRDGGANRVVLVAPYLCYMRQDKAFHPGEAVSQRVIGEYLSSIFDRVITVDPHLHRISDLQSIFNECQAESLSATGVIAESLAKEQEVGRRLFVGPDSESRQWVGAIADQLDQPFLVGEKTRHGDRQVRVVFENSSIIHGMNVVIVDDVISSGATICRCAETLLSAGAQSIEVVTVHILCDDKDLAAMKQAGISRIRSTDSIKHPTNSISLAPLLGNSLIQEK